MGFNDVENTFGYIEIISGMELTDNCNFRMLETLSVYGKVGGITPS